MASGCQTLRAIRPPRVSYLRDSHNCPRPNEPGGRTREDSMRPVAVTATLFVALILGPVDSRSVTPTHLWSANWGSTSTDRVHDLVVDAAGNVYMTGHFINNVSFGGATLVNAGGSDIFIVKYSAQGVHQWSFRHGGTGFDTAYGIVLDASGNVYLTGNFEGSASFGGATLVSAGSDDIFLAKYNSSGTHMWSARYGGTAIDLGRHIAITSTGDGFLTGEIQNTVNFGGANLTSAGSYDIFLFKFSAAGAHLLSQRFGGTGLDSSSGVAVDVSGDPVLTGAFAGTVNFGGSNLVSAGSSDIFLAKYTNGLMVHLWSKRFGDTLSDASGSVAIDATDDIWMTGSFRGTVNFGTGSMTSASASATDIYLARFDEFGTNELSRRFGGTSSDDGADITIDLAGNIVFCGDAVGPIDFGGGLQSSGNSTFSDVFVAKFTGDGSYLWSLVAGGNNPQFANAVDTDASGHVVVGGQMSGLLNLGGNVLASSVASADAFLAAYTGRALEPEIESIADIGNDQGRRVNVRFRGSGRDDPEIDPPVLSYEVYRRDAAPPSFAIGDPIADSRRAMLDAGWTFAGSVPAHEQESYALDVATIGDSTVALGPYYSAFFVRAAQADPGEFFDSPIDSGYSLDNLAPGIPQNFVYDSNQLSWDESAADDFKFFTVYGSNVDSFGSATLVDYIAGVSMNVSGSPYVFYYLTATDFSGNEGNPARVNTLSGAGGTPNRYVLSVSNYPNPFNPNTTVSYTVPVRGHVRVSVYDTRGGHVASLFDGERSEGAYRAEWNPGAAASSGVYFARIEHNGVTRSKKMLLLK